MNRYPNKRQFMRTGGGQFRKATGYDFGIGGVCPTCGHLLLSHYDGDPRDAFPDPRNFRFRCFTCEPETEAEKALKAEIEAGQPKPKSLMDILMEASAKEEAQAKAAQDAQAAPPPEPESKPDQPPADQDDKPDLPSAPESDGQLKLF